MTINLIWSIALASIGILGIYLAGNKSRWGWAIGFSAQALWIIFAIVTAQYGFILSAFAYGIVYGRNWAKWRATNKPAQIVIRNPHDITPERAAWLLNRARSAGYR